MSGKMESLLTNKDFLFYKDLLQIGARLSCHAARGTSHKRPTKISVLDGDQRCESNININVY